MPAIGITGGVATGKSSFVRALAKHHVADLFDADACVHELLANHARLKEEIVAAFGAATLGPDGTVDRVKLRGIVFEDETARKRLEELIHPRVEEVWGPRAAEARESSKVALFDIPLLYETKIEERFDRILVIACSPSIQRDRLQQNRGLASDLIERILSAQLDLQAKVTAAHHVVWNDGSPAVLDAQARLFAAYLREYYG